MDSNMFESGHKFWPMHKELKRNKICKKRLGLLLSPPFLPTRMVWSENKKWLFCEKYHFLPSDQVWKMWLGHIAKNEPKTHYHLKMAFLVLNRKQEFFVVQNQQKPQKLAKLPVIPDVPTVGILGVFPRLKIT